MKKTLGVILLALLSVIVPFGAEAAESAKAGIDCNIRFFDRRIYYVDGDPIYIQVTITNNSPATYRFKLADDRVFSLDFDARTISNRSLEAADSLLRKRAQSRQVFFREIAVEAGESFSFVEDLRGYIKLTEPESLVIKARIYPELFRQGTARTAVVNGSPSSIAASGEVLESQRLSLSIRPSVITGPDGVPLAMDIATGAALVRERLAPDQVVEYTITARQKSQWERFFLYLDLESMLTQDPVRQRKWLTESEAGRRRMVEEYRQELQNSTTDGTISIIPSEFVIERTQYNNAEGSVTVLQKFRNSSGSSSFTEKKQYTYSVRMKDNVWTIVDYAVINLGTE